MRQIILDTETTGLSPEAGHRVIEIGCVELLNRKLTGNNRHYYLNPDRKSDPEALRVHGITDEFLLDKPRFHQIADEFLDYLSGAEVIIHNAPFDVAFLSKELELAGGRASFRTWVAQVTDTLVLAKELFPGKRNSLDALCDRLGVDNSGRTLHGALLDAELLADVYINLTRGQDALLIEDHADVAQSGPTLHLDLSRFSLPVVPASETECKAHEEILAQLEKSSAGQVVWRKMENSVQ